MTIQFELPYVFWLVYFYQDDFKVNTEIMKIICKITYKLYVFIKYKKSECVSKKVKHIKMHTKLERTPR